MTHAQENGTKDRPKLTPEQTLFWDGIISWIAMLLLWVAIEQERVGVLDWFSHPEKGGLGIGIICAGSAMAFIFNISSYYFILYTSALSSMVGSNAIKIFLIVISSATDQIYDALSISGIVITILAISAYAYFSYEQKKRKAEEKETDRPIETTPLAGKEQGGGEEGGYVGGSAIVEG